MTVEFETLGPKPSPSRLRTSTTQFVHHDGQRLRCEALHASTDADTGFMTVSLENAYLGREASASLFLTENAPTFTSLTVWQVCEGDTGVPEPGQLPAGCLGL